MSPEVSSGVEVGAVAAQVQRVRGAIAAAAERAGRAPATITLIAVTKTVPPTLIQQAYDAGVRHFGENRVQEAVSKIAALELPDARWEMIGTLQRNKARAAVDHFGRIHSVTSQALAEDLARQAAQRGIVLPVLIQVNVAGEATKQGVAPAEALPLARIIAGLPHLRGSGLMTVAPNVADPAAVRPVFRHLRELRDTIRAALGDDWLDLSMGMTNDFPAAIAEGATLVRIGRALFGART